MKNRLIVWSSALMLALAFAAQGASFRPDNDQDRYRERDEIRQTHELASGARVEVSGINGKVEIETNFGDTAEIHVVRSARNRDDLNYRKVIIEYTPNKLVIRGEDERERGRRRNSPNVRQEVMLSLPRNIDLSTSGVNGHVKVGEVDGPVRVSGVNGKVTVDQAVGYSHLSGINGHVTVTIARLGERGIHVSGINGGVELRFADELNADLDVTGINGSVRADVPNVVVQGKLNPHNFHARIGGGGSRISVSGVNGGVQLVRSGR